MSEPPPPSYDEAILGRPFTIAPVVIHPYPAATCLHCYVFQESPAPSTPPQVSSLPESPAAVLPPLPSTLYEWQRCGLDLITNLHQVHISCRLGDSYIFTDTTKSLLYSATLDMGNECMCCSVPRGPGVTFNLTSRHGQHVMVVHRAAKASCFPFMEMRLSVCIPPDVLLGTVEGRDAHCILCNASGDIVCDVEQEEVCCSCKTLPYQVIPSGFPHDTGSIAVASDGLLITFPSVLDVPTRTLLLCCALNLQYMHEEQERERPAS
ncbi:uncharacterized protein [Procambarus clarkii]|uniref:uncharacterized protein isoform X1 n=1 Tax=Procambarus clarkii TaxID=6728 RepID=UPI0037440895